MLWSFVPRQYGPNQILLVTMISDAAGCDPAVQSLQVPFRGKTELEPTEIIYFHKYCQSFLLNTVVSKLPCNRMFSPQEHGIIIRLQLRLRLENCFLSGVPCWNAVSYTFFSSRVQAQNCVRCSIPATKGPVPVAGAGEKGFVLWGSYRLSGRGSTGGN